MIVDSISVSVTGKPEIEEVIYLQRYKEGWSDGKWEEKMDERECLENTGFIQVSFLDHSREFLFFMLKLWVKFCLLRKQDEEGLWRSWFWGYSDTYTLDFKCISIQAQYTFLKPYLLEKTTARWKLPPSLALAVLCHRILMLTLWHILSFVLVRSVMLMRAEHVIHGSYSEWSSVWWTVSALYFSWCTLLCSLLGTCWSSRLEGAWYSLRNWEILVMNSDVMFSTLQMKMITQSLRIGPKWRWFVPFLIYLWALMFNLHFWYTFMQRNHGDALGGPYLAVHLRRKDFKSSHKKDVPSLEEAARQIKEVLEKQQLDTVFVATDAPLSGMYYLHCWQFLLFMP